MAGFRRRRPVLLALARSTLAVDPDLKEWRSRVASAKEQGGTRKAHAGARTAFGAATGANGE